jgi:hypothetical protein
MRSGGESHRTAARTEFEINIAVRSRLVNRDRLSLILDSG